MSDQNYIFGFEYNHFKAEARDDKKEKMSEVVFDMRTGIKTSRKKEANTGSHQNAIIEKWQLGFQTSSGQKRLVNYDNNQKALVAAKGDDSEWGGLGFRSNRKELNPVKNQTEGDSDSEEEYIDEVFKAQNPRLLRKRTRKYEGKATIGQGFNQSYKSIGLRF